MRKIVLIIAIAGLLSVLLGAGSIFQQGGVFTPCLPETGGTLKGSLNIQNKLVITDSLRVAKTSIFTGDITASGDLYLTDTITAANGVFSGRITGTDLEVSDSVKSVSIVASGRITGTDCSVSDSVKAVSIEATGRVTCTDLIASDTVSGNRGDFGYVTITGDVTIVNHYFDDSQYYLYGVTDTARVVSVNGDTLDVNTKGNVGNVKLGGRVNSTYIDVDTVHNTGWMDSPYISVDYFLPDTIYQNGQNYTDIGIFIDSTEIKSYFDSTTVNTKLSSKADTTGRPAFIIGNSKGAGGDDTVDTLVHVDITATSIVLLTPAFNAAGLVYIAGIATDSLFIGYTADADSTGARVYGCNYWISK